MPTGTAVVTLKVNYLLTGSQTEGENSAKRHCVILWWCQSRTIINIQNIANWKWTWCYLQVWISNSRWNSLKPIWLKISKITMHWICTGFKCVASRSCKYCHLTLKIALIVKFKVTEIKPIYGFPSLFKSNYVLNLHCFHMATRRCT